MSQLPISYKEHKNPFDHNVMSHIPMKKAPIPSGPYGKLNKDSSYNRKMDKEPNVSDRFELFILGPGESKVKETPDTRTPNTSIFLFNKEDHTLANLLRAHLLKDPRVNFSGYRVPHPLFATFELRVQTNGEITPKEAIITCCKQLVADLGHVEREFTKEWELRKMVDGSAAAAAVEHGEHGGRDGGAQ